MDEFCADAGQIRLVFHDDDVTPHEFALRLLRTVFGKPEREAIALFSGIDQKGTVACGPYPASVGKALLEAAQREIRASGYPLLITGEAVRERCDLCGAPEAKTDVPLAGRTASLCGPCTLAVVNASAPSLQDEFKFACEALSWHFAGTGQGGIVTMVRQFPGASPSIRLMVKVPTSTCWRLLGHGIVASPVGSAGWPIVTTTCHSTGARLMRAITASKR